MDDIINWLIRNVPDPVRSWILNLAYAIKAITDRVLSALFGQADAFMHMAQFLGGFLEWLKRHGQAIYNWGYWLMTVRIPRAISNAVNDLLRLVAGWVDDVRNFASNLMAFARAEAHSLFDFVRSEATQFANWVIGEFNDLIAAFLFVQNIVFTLLTDPAKLAEWLIAALLPVAGRYLVANAVPLARWAWPRLLPAAVEAIDIAEQIIVDIA
jgi:hypothetical protein